jgi:6-phosphofructokinase 1
MVGFQNEDAVCVPLEEVVGEAKIIPLDHPWITGARHVGIVFGD